MGSGAVQFSASGYDQFHNQIAASNLPTLHWSATAGQISSGGAFTPPPISEPCQVTVSASGVSASEPVTINNPSPETSGRVGEGWIEPLFEQALGSGGSSGDAAANLAWLTGGWSVRRCRRRWA